MGDTTKLLDMLQEQSLDHAKYVNILLEMFISDLKLIRKSVKKLSRESVIERKIAREEALINFIDQQIDGYDK